MRPPRELSGVIECVWLLEPAIEWSPERVARAFPDGATDIVLTGKTPLVYGPAPSVRFLPTSIHAIGLRLRAGAAISVLGETPCAFGEQPVPLESIWQTDLSEIEGLMAGRAATGILLDAFIRKFAKRPSSARAADLLVRAMADRLSSPGGASLREICDRFELGERQLRRRFREHTGLGPKYFSRIRRFQRSLDKLRAHKRSSVGLAAEDGFADQAHLVRETGHFAGLTPGRLFEVL